LRSVEIFHCSPAHGDEPCTFTQYIRSPHCAPVPRPHEPHNLAKTKGMVIFYCLPWGYEYVKATLTILSGACETSLTWYTKMRTLTTFLSQRMSCLIWT